MQKEWSQIRRAYFIGIGGIGMSAIVRYFIDKGVHVSGYDRTETALTRKLEAEGVQIHFEEDLKRIDLLADLVVYTPAIPASHRELVYYREQGYAVVKRSEVLGIITRPLINICVAGTHGKTTISTMVAHIMRQSRQGCNAFLGGIAVNYDTNFWSSDSKYAVIEADEYDRSFLRLYPDFAVISSMDPDHLDIYGSGEAMQEAFMDFASLLRPGGKLFIKQGLPKANRWNMLPHAVYSYQDTSADVYAANIRQEWGGYHFDVHHHGEMIDALYLPMGGWHNVENAVVATAVCREAGVEPDEIRKALAGFRGVKRRFEYILRDDSRVYIDDYAHHPEELRALITSARQLFPDRPCHVVFQPHLFSRTRDLADGFAESLDLADEVALLPIYPARELPMEGVSSAMIGERMRKARVHLIDKPELGNWIRQHPAPLWISAGAGDIDKEVEGIKKAIEE